MNYIDDSYKPKSLKEKLRIIFMGTPDFAVESLKMLVDNNFNIVGVITAPDKPAGRGQKIRKSSVKVYAESQDLHILQPTNLKDSFFLDELKSLKADLQIIVAFRMLPEAVWNMPLMGTFNLHASLLPQYRGAAPINWAVINGEKETGVTTFFLQHEIDTGNIILQEKVKIGPNDNAGVIHDRLMVTGAKLVLKTVNFIAEGKTDEIPQEQVKNSEQLKSAPKIFKNDCRIDWTLPAGVVHNKIRGLSPYPASWTEVELADGKSIPVKVYESELLTEELLSPGETDSDGKNYLKIGTGSGCISIKRLQVAGKKQMSVADFLRGFDVKTITRVV